MARQPRNLQDVIDHAEGRTPEPEPEAEPSLADLLEVFDPDQPARPTPNITIKPARQLCLDILNSREYRESLHRRLITDTLPAQVECRLFEYAYGKPVDRVEVRTPRASALASLTPEQLRERALLISQKLAANKVN